MSNENISKKVIPRGVYLLPSILTMFNILCGFYAVINAFSHSHLPNAEDYYVRSALLIIFAGIFDALDGRIARMTGTTSAFGAQLDSIADVVSFGMAPGILAYCWALDGFLRFGWIPSFLFLGCGAIRLARFNVMMDDDADTSSKHEFIGLPIPAAACTVATFVLIKPAIESPGFLALLVLLSMYILSFLMVSKLRFRSFKDVEWRKRHPLGVLFFFVLFLVVLMHKPTIFLFILAVFYVLSGVLAYILPETMLNVFRRLDKCLLETKILDDDESQQSENEAVKSE